MQTQIFIMAFFILGGFLWWFSQSPSESRLDFVTSSGKTPSNTCNWRPEPLAGECDVTKVTTESKAFDNAADCEDACCESDECVSWQFREKEGCQWGGDTRLGAEKDGVSAWCEPRAPAVWHGQWVKKNGNPIEGACSADTANLNELRGQCFGLGSKKHPQEDTAEGCRSACCADESCGIWQWRSDSGCFYHKSGHGCKDANPLDFEKFDGKRKVMPDRKYEPYAYSKDFADLAGSEFA